jgi:hypothetical protein
MPVYPRRSKGKRPLHPRPVAADARLVQGRGISVAMEYIEPGASATDDRRAVFQQMVSDATLVKKYVFRGQSHSLHKNQLLYVE